MEELKRTKPNEYIAHLTGEVLLQITKGVIANQLNHHMRKLDLTSALSSDDVVVSMDDITDVGEALKGVVFFVPVATFLEAFELAEKEFTAKEVPRR